MAGELAKLLRLHDSDQSNKLSLLQLFANRTWEKSGIRLAPFLGMRTKFAVKTGALALALSLSPSWVIYAQSDSSVKPDNTKVNKRDKNPGEVTAEQQKVNPADRDLTAKIRKAVVADKSLSTYAHNVKIVSQDGTVTLKGPVKSDAEVQTIVSKATEIAGGPSKVVNQLSVAP